MKKILVCLCFVTAFYGCQSDASSSENAASAAKNEAAVETAPEKKSTAPIEKVNVNKSGILTRNGIRLTPILDSPKFENTKLIHKSPTSSDHLHAGDIDFDFEIEGDFELGKQTPEATKKGLPNSEKGQAIKVLLNNLDFGDFTSLENTIKIAGGHFSGLAVLTTSYGEAVKAQNAHQMFDFTVGHGSKNGIDPKGRHLFYVGPQGEYKSDEKVLLDFYVVNTEMSLQAAKVRVTINGTPFLLNDWRAYFIDGLKSGENSVKLELLDENKRLIPGKFNTVSRTFIVK